MISEDVVEMKKSSLLDQEELKETEIQQLLERNETVSQPEQLVKE